MTNLIHVVHINISSSIVLSMVKWSLSTKIDQVCYSIIRKSFIPSIFEHFLICHALLVSWSHILIALFLLKFVIMRALRFLRTVFVVLIFFLCIIELNLFSRSLWIISHDLKTIVREFSWAHFLSILTPIRLWLSYWTSCSTENLVIILIFLTWICWRHSVSLLTNLILIWFKSIICRPCITPVSIKNDEIIILWYVFLEPIMLSKKANKLFAWPIIS